MICYLARKTVIQSIITIKNSEGCLSKAINLRLLVFSGLISSGDQDFNFDLSLPYVSIVFFLPPLAILEFVFRAYQLSEFPFRFRHLSMLFLNIHYTHMA